jgi:hypothetical protein
MFTRLPYPSYIMPAMTVWDIANHIPKRGPQLSRGMQSSGFLGKTRQVGQRRLEQIERGTK